MYFKIVELNATNAFYSYINVYLVVRATLPKSVAYRGVENFLPVVVRQDYSRWPRVGIFGTNERRARRNLNVTIGMTVPTYICRIEYFLDNLRVDGM